PNSVHKVMLGMVVKTSHPLSEAPLLPSPFKRNAAAAAGLRRSLTIRVGLDAPPSRNDWPFHETIFIQKRGQYDPYPASIRGEVRRIFRPPCGSPLNATTNSVPLPVSELNASSEMMSDDRGDILSAIKSRVS